MLVDSKAHKRVVNKASRRRARPAETPVRSGFAMLETPFCQDWLWPIPLSFCLAEGLQKASKYASGCGHHFIRIRGGGGGGGEGGEGVGHRGGGWWWWGGRGGIRRAASSFWGEGWSSSTPSALPEWWWGRSWGCRAQTTFAQIGFHCISATRRTIWQWTPPWTNLRDFILKFRVRKRRKGNRSVRQRL